MWPNSKEELTLVAAIVAAVASLVSAVLNIRAVARSEMRAARRRSLEEHVGPLSKTLHELLACSTTLTKTNSYEARVNWRQKGQDAKEELKRLRPLLRYPLWGLDKGLRDLTRLPDWTEALQKDRERTEELLRLANRLKDALDAAVCKSYANGTHPGVFSRLAVAFADWRYTRFWETAQKERNLGIDQP